MESDSISAQNSIEATCIECEETRRFDMADGYPEARMADFDCTICGHTIRLALDP